jgi:hypothetical protein
MSSPRIHSPGLASAADADLGLDHGRLRAELLVGGHGLVRGSRHLAREHGHRKPLEQVPRLILQEIHVVPSDMYV